MAVNKIIYGGQTLIDLTADTIDKSAVFAPYTFHDRSGEEQTGEAKLPGAAINYNDGNLYFSNDLYAVDIIDGDLVLDENTGVRLQEKVVSPLEVIQYIGPDAGYDALSLVTVNPIETQTKRATSNGTVTPDPGKYLTSVEVAVPSSEPRLQTKSTAPSETAQDVIADAGYDGLSKVSISAISKTYVGSSVTRQSAKTVTPTKATQTVVASGVYTTGAVSVGPIPSNYIIPSGSQTLTENKTYDVTSLASVTVNVPSSGDSGMNVQGYHGYASVIATSYTATEVKLTVKKTGTYKVSWMGWRNTNSGTSGSQLYINGSAYGSANTSFKNTYGQSVVLNNVSLTAGQEIVVRARARSTSYVMAVGNLLIEQTA